jgi:hypothetical protein
VSALALTAVLVVAGLGVSGCLAFAAALVGWLLRDARESREAGAPVWTTVHRPDGNVESLDLARARRARRDRAPGGAA